MKDGKACWKATNPFANCGCLGVYGRSGVKIGFSMFITLHYLSCWYILIIFFKDRKPKNPPNVCEIELCGLHDTTVNHILKDCCSKVAKRKSRVESIYLGSKNRLKLHWDGRVNSKAYRGTTCGSGHPDQEAGIGQSSLILGYMRIAWATCSKASFPPSQPFPA